MKKIVFITTIVLIIIFTVLLSFAIGTDEITKYILSIDYTKLSEEECYLINNCKISDGYKVTYLQSSPITKIKDCGFSNEILSDLVQWRIPSTTKDGNEAQLVFSVSNETIEYVGYITGEKIISNEISEKSVAALIKQNGLVEPDAIQIYYSAQYESTFVCFESDGVNLIIPYLNEAVEKETSIVSKNIYTRDALLDIFNNTYDESFYQENPDYNGGPVVNNSFNYTIMLYVLGLVIITALIVIFIIQNRKKAK